MEHIAFLQLRTSLPYAIKLGYHRNVDFPDHTMMCQTVVRSRLIPFLRQFLDSRAELTMLLPFSRMIVCGLPRLAMKRARDLHHADISIQTFNLDMNNSCSQTGE